MTSSTRTPRWHAAATAIENWQRERGPLLSCYGGLWTYAEGIWRPIDPDLTWQFRVAVDRAMNSVGLDHRLDTTRDVHDAIGHHPDIYREGVAWDPRAVIVLKNCAFDLSSRSAQAHSPDHLATRRLNVPYVEGATCPKTDAFLASLFADRPPEEAAQRVATLWEWLGSTLGRKLPRDLRKALWLYGNTRTGKSRVTAMLRLIFEGSHVSAADPSDLDERFAMEPLLGAVAWIADDVLDEGGAVKGSRFKKLVTGEDVEVRRMRRGHVQASFDIPILFTSNPKPYFSDSSDACYDRIIAMRFSRQFTVLQARPEREIETDMRSELPGILLKMLAGYARLQDRGHFVHYDWMADETADFKAGMHIIPEWIKDCVVVDPACRVETNDLLCSLNGFKGSNYGHVRGSREYGGVAMATALKNTYPMLNRMKSNGEVLWCGIKLTEDGEHYGRFHSEATRRSKAFRGNRHWAAGGSLQ